MPVIRTPESRFAGLPDYPFAPNYLDVGGTATPGLRMHYLDEGPRDGRVVLMLHGEPSWSYLYRHMIPPVVAAGCRVIAPDLIGFGKSDKLTRISDYSYQSHMDWLTALVEQLDLRDITVVGQDWGSLLGLRLAAEQEPRCAAIVIGNGMLPTGDQPVPKAFRIWKHFALYSPWFPIGRIVASGVRRKLPDGERAAYDAPFPSAQYKAGARAFPRLVPVTPDDPASPANRTSLPVTRSRAMIPLAWPPTTTRSTCSRWPLTGSRWTSFGATSVVLPSNETCRTTPGLRSARAMPTVPDPQPRSRMRRRRSARCFPRMPKAPKPHGSSRT